MLKLSYSKPFYNTLNYASIANIEEVMNFYNTGDKTFETDFSFRTYQTQKVKATNDCAKGHMKVRLSPLSLA